MRCPFCGQEMTDYTYEPIRDPRDYEDPLTAYAPTGYWLKVRPCGDVGQLDALLRLP